jgi:hypothetical protein
MHQEKPEVIAQAIHDCFGGSETAETIAIARVLIPLLVPDILHVNNC